MCINKCSVCQIRNKCSKVLSSYSVLLNTYAKRILGILLHIWMYYALYVFIYFVYTFAERNARNLATYQELFNSYIFVILVFGSEFKHISCDHFSYYLCSAINHTLSYMLCLGVNLRDISVIHMSKFAATYQRSLEMDIYKLQSTIPKNLKGKKQCIYKIHFRSIKDFGKDEKNSIISASCVQISL